MQYSMFAASHTCKVKSSIHFILQNTVNQHPPDILYTTHLRFLPINLDQCYLVNDLQTPSSS